MKKIICLSLTLLCVALGAIPISRHRADALAETMLDSRMQNQHIAQVQELRDGDTSLAYIYTLQPTGYMVLSADDTLPPLMAYSPDSDYDLNAVHNPLRDLLIGDLSARLSLADSRNAQAWQRAEQHPQNCLPRNDYLLSARWNQTHPWNMMCPMDPVTNTRSVAGCPAIAMGQILDYLKALNGTRLDDSDDYQHNYAGRNYRIDDDYAALQFPSFPQLNAYLDRVNHDFKYETPLIDSLQAALVFAAGTALTQIYSADASGTFAVSQAYAAYQRFGFDNAVLLGPEASDVYTRMISNIADGIPVHLAVVTPAWDAGHNVVVDGYESEMYHLNFGWGGQYNGWYNLPEGIPYNLTVIEGAVVDLMPREYIYMDPLPDYITYGVSLPIDIINLSDTDQILEEIIFGEGLVAEDWEVSIELPATLEALGFMSFTITNLIPVRDIIHTGIKLVFSDFIHEIPLDFDEGYSTSDHFITPARISVKVSPNPFSQSCELSISGSEKIPSKLEVFNLRGQKVHESPELRWEGQDSTGKSSPAGVYLYRVSGNGFNHVGRLLKH